jgi:mRNA interferase MazF
MNFEKWEIRRANLDPIVGSEQGKTRPVLIISENIINDNLNTINIIPITTRKINRIIYPNEVLILKDEFGLKNESILLCHQIRTLDKQRLNFIYGKIELESIQSEILEALKFQFGIM